MVPPLVLLVALFLAPQTPLADADGGVFARDGKGHPVSWFVVYKLPMLARTGDGSDVAPTPCDCAPPNCAQQPTEGLDVSARASGLCYLYADSNNATLRHFRELGYDCLGQGGDDPVSHTLRHIQPKEASTQAKYWAIYSDQLNGIAASYAPPASVGVDANAGKRVCSGGDDFSAHAKGAVAFDGVDGGFLLQTSTPNFPDPSHVGEGRTDKFIPLGCQKDNNVHFAQHMVGLSIDMVQMNALGKQLQAARLCSGNIYQDLRTALASESLLHDGTMPERNANFSNLYKALLDSGLEGVDASPTAKMSLREVSAREGREKHSRVYLPGKEDQPLLLQEHTDIESATTITVTVKTPRAAVPPWALVAEVLQSDLSVATWWDGGFGIPNICAGDVYLNASERFCLDNADHGVELNSNGTAKFNVENLIEAAWLLPNSTERTFWHLVGGSKKDGNHAKWGVSTPRFGSSTEQTTNLVAFGDLNMEGYPCSSTCRGSQAGRGGSFFIFDQPQLHSSFVHSLVNKACPCVTPITAQDSTFATLRMCRMGCWHKVEAHYDASELPVMTSDAASFWSQG